MRSNVTRLATFLGLSIALIWLWASPAFAHGDWHQGDGGSVSGSQWDPNQDGGCDHARTAGTSTAQQTDEQQTDEADASDDPAAEHVAGDASHLDLFAGFGDAVATVMAVDVLERHVA